MCIVVDAIGERVMRYGAAVLQTIAAVLEANRRRGAAEDVVDDSDDGEDDGDQEEEEEMKGHGGGANGDEMVDAAAASSDVPAAAHAADSWIHQGIFGEESHSGPSDSSNSWQVLYFAVFAFEKLESHCPALLRDAAAAPVTRLMCGATALLHSHPWVSEAVLPSFVKADNLTMFPEIFVGGDVF